MIHEFIFAGFGGQGVMFAGQILAYAAMESGFEVTWIPSYGPEMRGGTAHCYVVISDTIIGSPVVRNPKVAVVFNKPSFDKCNPIVAPEGLLALNGSLVEQRTQREDITQIVVPATQIAYQLGDARLANMVMLGAVLTQRPIVPLDAIRQALEAHIPAHRRDKLALNLQALTTSALVEG